jgi:iron(III)-enterobactin esterase
MKKSLFAVFSILVVFSTAFVSVSHAAACDNNTLQPTGTVSASVAQSNPTATPAIATSQPTPAPTAQPTLAAAGPSGAQIAVQPRATATAVPTSSVPYQPYKLETLGILSESMGSDRIAQIYLPGSYAQNPQQRYPVLYSFDGQQLPEMNFEQNLNQLVSSGQIAPVIVVAVFSTEGDLRREELGTGTTLNMLGWGTQSDAFNQFVISELLPRVNQGYRTLTGAANTGVMGWSLGGLTAFYIAWQNPDVFGTVGAFSPSFWWRTPSAEGEELQARVVPNLVRGSTARSGMRMWFEAGTAEQPYSDVDHNGVIDMIQDVQDTMSLLSAKGYQNGTDMVYVQVEGGQHELATWETVMPNFLKFAYGI